MEHFFTCPYCWATVSVVIDPSVPSQTYVEDCEVCCHPMEIRYVVDEESIVDFAARVLE
jgi:hypothetical protein